jgi:effector-binding domain-containing protein
LAFFNTKYTKHALLCYEIGHQKQKKITFAFFFIKLLYTYMNLLKKYSIVFFIALIISYFIPIKTTKQASIKKPFFDVVTEINNATHWKKWYAPIKLSYQKHPNSYRCVEDYKNKKFTIFIQNKQYEVTKYSPGALKIKDNAFLNTTREVRIVFTKSNDAIIFETRVLSLLNYIITYFKANEPYNSIINNLKPFMETPSLYYGFEIKRVKVPDTNYLTLTQTVLLKNRYIAADSMYSRLKKYAIKNKLLAEFKPYWVQTAGQKDSVMVTALLVINKPLELYGSDISFFSMPSVGNILVAHYKGAYGKSKSVYDALQQYVNDNALSAVFTPFERYLNKRIPQNDNTMVDMEVFYPIY